MLQTLLRRLGFLLCLVSLLFAVISAVNFRPPPKEMRKAIELGDKAASAIREQLQDSLPDTHVLPPTPSEMRRRDAWLALSASVLTFAGGLFLVFRFRRNRESDVA